MRFGRLHGALAGALAILAFALAACVDEVRPCDEYARFAEALAPRCGELTWDCQAEYGTLGPERQQDLDWCMDCFREEAEGTRDASCLAAPTTGQDCGALLDETLDASCFGPP